MNSDDQLRSSLWKHHRLRQKGNNYRQSWEIGDKATLQIFKKIFDL